MEYHVTETEDNDDINDIDYQPYPSLLDTPKSRSNALFIWRRSFWMLMFGALLFCSGVVVLIISLTVLPEHQRKMCDNDIRNLYVPSENSIAFEHSMCNDYDGDGLTYRTFWFYNITNATNVLFNEEPIELELVGPFVYWFHEHRKQPKVTTKTLSYLPMQTYETILDNITFSGIMGESAQTYTPLDPDSTHLRLLNPVLMSVLHHVMYNPFNDTSFTNFRMNCEHKMNDGDDDDGDFNINEALKCLNRVFLQESGDKVSLNHTLNDVGQGLIPLRRASDWLGLDGSNGVVDELWVAVERYIRKTFNPTNDYSWSYFANSSINNPTDLQRYVKSEIRMHDPKEMDNACTYYATNGLFSLHDMNITHAYRTPNSLNFDFKFVGWGANVTFPESHLRDGIHTHPYVDYNIDASFSVWDPVFLRPLRFTSSYDVEFLDLIAYRYRIDESNYDNWVNEFVFYSNYSGFMNATQSRSYEPIFINNPPSSSSSASSSIPFCHSSSCDFTMMRSYMDIEPVSGMVINKAFRYQYNVQIPAFDFTDTSIKYALPNITSVHALVPTFITEERYQCSGSQADMYRGFQDLQHTLKLIRLWGSVLGALAAICGFALFRFGYVRCKHDSNSDKKKPIYPNTSTALIYDTSR